MRLSSYISQCQKKGMGLCVELSTLLPETRGYVTTYGQAQIFVQLMLLKLRVLFKFLINIETVNTATKEPSHNQTKCRLNLTASNAGRTQWITMKLAPSFKYLSKLQIDPASSIYAYKGKNCALIRVMWTKRTSCFSSSLLCHGLWALASHWDHNMRVSPLLPETDQLRSSSQPNRN